MRVLIITVISNKRPFWRAWRGPWIFHTCTTWTCTRFRQSRERWLRPVISEKKIFTATLSPAESKPKLQSDLPLGPNMFHNASHLQSWYQCKVVLEYLMPSNIFHNLDILLGIYAIADIYMSRRTKIPRICICENKDADQLCSNCTADLRLFFFATRIVQFLFY